MEAFGSGEESLASSSSIEARLFRGLQFLCGNGHNGFDSDILM